ncbi:type I-E CRISPR-associated protein Cas6/Cse3/CasE [Nocardiopsis sp. FR6]|uniref:type I-E CRISPR-associated protein Cas6/Cse3/CasE n=1 Tax=Nocardiopsis sp. FR6 TaxID=2605986 RepID=UPI001358B3E4|nr:type I-E CRISPR-associated protein Cas6/Cse3/CasE [Nocardiopsis sp. FR6]
MPYLSRIRINPLRSGAQPLLKNPHQMKIAVLGGVPGRPPEEPVLWRLDTFDRHQPHLLVLTHTKPSWDHIVERAGWPGADGEHALVRDYEPLLARLVIGREFAFRVTANPVQSTITPDKLTEHQSKALDNAPPSEGQSPLRRGFRVGHRSTRHQMDWLLRRVPKAGFEIPLARTAEAGGPGMPEQGDPVPDVRLAASRQVRFHKHAQRKQNPPITLMTATFEGRLRVTDPDLLRTALLTGLGPAKRYGCGLLTLAPLAEARNHG